MTIFHKAMIAGACEIVKAEKDDPGFSCVLFEPDGTIIARSQYAIFVAQPTLEKVARSLPFPSDKKLVQPIAISLDQLISFLRSIPADRQFKGLLEHISLSPDVNGKVRGDIVDGKGTKHNFMRISQPKPALLQWRERMRSLSLGVGIRDFVFNRKRIGCVINAIEAACKYDGEFSYIVQKPFEGGYIWRCLNELTGQNVIVAHAMQASNKPIENTQWEETLYAKVNSNNHGNGIATAGRIHRVSRVVPIGGMPAGASPANGKS